jgi:hypothetical protein
MVLPPQNYVYYTWLDPLKPRQLVISCGSKTTELELTVRRFSSVVLLFVLCSNLDPIELNICMLTLCSISSIERNSIFSHAKENLK